jgi:hypothetical protein
MTVHPEWHEAMVNSSIDIFEMSHEESFSYFKITRTNGPSLENYQ